MMFRQCSWPFVNLDGLSSMRVAFRQCEWCFVLTDGVSLRARASSARKRVAFYVLTRLGLRDRDKGSGWVWAPGGNQKDSTDSIGFTRP
eukprot:50253-Pleurochrysis_carterae.AAC.2